MKNSIREVLSLIYDRDFEDMDLIETQDLLELIKQDKLGIDARLKCLAALVGRLHEKKGKRSKSDE